MNASNASPATDADHAVVLPPTRAFDSVEAGEHLPDLAIPLDRSLIVATAIASRDFQPVHHDPSFAQNAGSQDVIMNILTTNGFVGRYITDWAGPNALLKRVSIRLGAPNYPGDTMTMTGQVTELNPETKAVVVAIRGANSLGDHVSGTVEVQLP